MKKIVRLTGLCLACFILLGVVSCGSKVNKEELDKKIEASLNSDKEPEFTDAEYTFMADYLYDNYDKLEKMDINDKEAEMAMAYGFILFSAQMEGKLNKKALETYKKIMKKQQQDPDVQNYKENEKALIEALRNSDIDWDNSYDGEEAVAVVEGEAAVAVEE